MKTADEHAKAFKLHSCIGNKKFAEQIKQIQLDAFKAGERFAAGCVWEGGEDQLAAQRLHLLERGLELSPVFNGLTQRLILLLGQCHAHGLTFDFACPLVTGSAGTRSAIAETLRSTS